MLITPQAIQDLLDELEASKQARMRAWAVLQRIRALLCDLGNIAIDPPPKKTFDFEGAILEQALKKCLFDRGNCSQRPCGRCKANRQSGIWSPGRLWSSASGSPQGARSRSGFYKKLSVPGVRHAKEISTRMNIK